MKKVQKLLLLMAVVISLTACNDKYPDLKDGLYAEIETTKGTVVAELFYDKAPMTVGNFVALAEGKHPKVADSLKGKPFYDGLSFHRVIPEFMIQGGDKMGTGAGDVGYVFPQEVREDLKHDAPGVLSMANAGPNTNGSQFFIMHKANASLDMNYNVFGKVVMNQQVVDSIAVTPTTQDKPNEPMLMKKITIIRKGDAAKKWDAVKAFNDGVAVFEKEKAEREKLMKTAGVAKKAEIMSFKEQAVAAGGIQVYTIRKGTGGKPAMGDIVGLMYSGYLEDGTMFGSNDKEATVKGGMYDPAIEAQGGYGAKPLQLSEEMQMIPGFKEAILTMGYGDKIMAFIPSELGYGAQGGGNVIPPNANLVFELEMSPKE